jgi:hypothetical protein
MLFRADPGADLGHLSKFAGANQVAARRSRRFVLKFTFETPSQSR